DAETSGYLDRTGSHRRRRGDLKRRAVTARDIRGQPLHTYFHGNAHPGDVPGLTSHHPSSALKRDEAVQGGTVAQLLDLPSAHRPVQLVVESGVGLVLGLQSAGERPNAGPQ